MLSALKHVPVLSESTSGWPPTLTLVAGAVQSTRVHGCGFGPTVKAHVPIENVSWLVVAG
jgi:hypothetical protein